jgi:serine/threonine protein kinase HipA of HipAB toxin-antitoxin module
MKPASASTTPGRSLLRRPAARQRCHLPRSAARFNTGSIQAFDLLAAIGRDCVGALQQLPDGEAPSGATPTTHICKLRMSLVGGRRADFSIQLLAGPGGRFRLTPLYDVMLAYPMIGNGPNQWSARGLRLAMALFGKNNRFHFHHIQRRHFDCTARKVGHGATAEPLVR